MWAIILTSHLVHSPKNLFYNHLDSWTFNYSVQSLRQEAQWLTPMYIYLLLMSVQCGQYMEGSILPYALWVHAPSIWWLCHPPGHAQIPLLDFLLSASQERGAGLREYQGQHFCTFPFARILSQGPNLLVKEVWTWSVPLHPGRENRIGDTQTVCHALHSYKHNSADLECLPVGPRQHTQGSRKRQAAGHGGLDLNLSLIFAC